MVAGTLTAYERRRLENIRRNDAMLATLNLPLKPIHTTTPPKPKKPKPNPNPTPIVPRRSLRSQGIPPSDSLPSPSPSPPSPPRGPLQMGEVAEGDHRGFVDAVRRMEDEAPIRGGEVVRNGGELDLTELRLEEGNVRRYLPGRVLSVGFFPVRDRTVVFAGDKYGNLGFWDADGGHGDGDGVCVYSPHSAPVSSVLVHPMALSKIFSCSYDGLIRSVDIQKETFDMIYSCNDEIYTATLPRHDPYSLYFGEGYGKLKILDTRAGKVSNSWVLHSSRINTVDFNPENPHSMVTSSTDSTVCIWDLRNIKHKKAENLKTVKHGKATHSAFFSPSGCAIATTSFDNNVRVVGGVDYDDISKFPRNNQTGRWLSSFRAIWGWDDTHLFIGNMKKAIDVIACGGSVKSLKSPLMTAIPARFAAHPYKLGFLAGATAGGQVYLWTI